MHTLNTARWGSIYESGQRKNSVVKNHIPRNNVFSPVSNDSLRTGIFFLLYGFSEQKRRAVGETRAENVVTERPQHRRSAGYESPNVSGHPEQRHPQASVLHDGRRTAEKAGRQVQQGIRQKELRKYDII